MARGRIERTGFVLNSQGPPIGQIGHTGQHLALRQSTSFVRADICNATDGFKSTHLADDDVAFRHRLGSDGHGNGEDSNERFGDNSDGHTDAVDESFAINIPDSC